MSTNWPAKVVQSDGMLSATETIILIKNYIDSALPVFDNDKNEAVLEQIDQYILRWRAFKLASSRNED